jgi:hypothetical protein
LIRSNRHAAISGYFRPMPRTFGARAGILEPYRARVNRLHGRHSRGIAYGISASSLFGMGSNDRCEHSSEVSWFGDGRFSAPA